MRIYKKKPSTDTIVYNGIAFNRYPESKQAGHRNYYRPHAGHIANGIGHLHQEIWKAKYGAIPKGHQIHHKDGNPLNNEIDNLECVTALEHKGKHKEFDSPVSGKMLEHLDRVRPLTKEWHSSEKGREWHSKISKQSWLNREPTDCTCTNCGICFLTTCPGVATGLNRFCSNSCLNRYRRKTLKDCKPKVCPVCKKDYLGVPKTKSCSRECGARLRWDTIKAAKSDRTDALTHLSDRV